MLSQLILFLNNKGFFHKRSRLKDFFFHLLLYPYLTFIYGIRTFFIKYPNSLVYFFFFFGLTNIIYPEFLFTFGEYVVFCIVLGVNLVAWDEFGSAMASVLLLKGSRGYYVRRYLALLKLCSKSHNFLVRSVNTATIVSMVTGTTKMSSTGRAAIIAGIISGVGFSINEHYNRQVKLSIAAQNTDATIKAAQIAAEAAVKTAQANAEAAVKTAQANANAAQANANAAQANAYSEYYKTHNNWSNTWFFRGNPPTPPNFKETSNKN
jgi:hypothetical protein